MEALKKQGLSFLILGGVVFYFYGELKEVRREVKNCQATIVEIYQIKNDELKDVIIRNTEALNKIESRINSLN
jgi:hypothetical protein